MLFWTERFGFIRPPASWPLYGTIVSFSEKQDFLAVALDMSLDEIVSSALDLDNDITEKIMKEMVPEQEQVLADVSVIRAVYRLFAAMKQPLGSEYIRRNIRIKEKFRSPFTVE